ncbi:hypothetical protein [Parapedobacter tibetensis]|uniref:hypothetical protein n=1 Tax=Parapedobacter tibetensis TaxID=2972951 RepID=UPI00214D9BF4|nr:hypothetical protein [Parapedobacter tibetensis]
MLLWVMVLGVLAVVVWQDFRQRTVYALAFPLLAVLVIIHAMWLGVFSFTTVAINLAIIALQLGLLNLIMYWRRKKWLMQGEQLMGWGDIAFFIVLALCFSTVNFILFYVISLLIVLLGALFAKAIGHQVKYIPLAGGQAALLAMVLLADYTQWGRQLFVDMEIMWLIYG